MSFGRVTPPEMSLNNITALENRPQLSATQLKTKFDKAGSDLQNYLVALVDEINGLFGAMEQYETDEETGATPGAANIGASAVFTGDESDSNVQAKLAALKNYMDGLLIAASAGDMLKSVYDSNGDGKVSGADDADKLGGDLPSAFAKAIGGQAAKTSIANNDAFPIVDSEDSGVQKKTLWSTMKSAIQTALASVFAEKSHNHNISDLSGVAASVHTHPYAAADHTHSDYASISHQHTISDLSGVAKSSGGIRIFIGDEDKSGAVDGDIWIYS